MPTDRGRRVQAQVVAGGRAADAASAAAAPACPARPRPRPPVGARTTTRAARPSASTVGALDARGAAVLHQHALDAAVDDEPRAGVGRVLQVGLQRPELGARHVAEARSARRGRRRTSRVGVAGDRAVVDARASSARVEQRAGWGRCRPSTASVTPIRALTASRWRSYSGARQPLQPVVALPLLADPVVGAQAVGPVDRRAAAEVGAGHQRDLARRRSARRRRRGRGSRRPTARAG